MSVELIFVFGVAAVVVAIMFNSMVAKKNEVDNAVGGVHAYLQKRADLIPSLVATVKQYAAHESKLLNDLTQMRAAVQNPNASGEEMQKTDSIMTQMLGRVVAVAENYPDLKANQNFLSLQSSLNEVEGQLSAARRNYNSVVVRYNIQIESFPTVIMARMLGYQRKPVFQVTPSTAQVPDVSKLFEKVG